MKTQTPSPELLCIHNCCEAPMVREFPKPQHHFASISKANDEQI